MEEHKSNIQDLSKIPGLRKLFDQKKTWTPMWHPREQYDSQKIVRCTINPQTKITKNRAPKRSPKSNVTLLHNAGATCFMVCKPKFPNNVLSINQCLSTHTNKIECFDANISENSNVSKNLQRLQSQYKQTFSQYDVCNVR